MKVLIVKTSSMGDLVHTWPALTDAGKAIPGIRFDWLAEKSFADIAALHPLVDDVIPVQIRKWRKHIFKSFKSAEWKTFRKQIKAKQYDAILDVQGLLKSAVLARMAKGPRFGFDRKSAREPIASFLYQTKIAVPKNQSMINRIRQIFAKALHYTFDEKYADAGVDRAQFHSKEINYITFLHGTTWVTKHWPEAYWKTLATLLTDAGYKIKLPWSNMAEKERAERIATIKPDAIEVLPKLSLSEVLAVVACSKAVVTLDTGLGHFSQALNVPTLSLFGPTDPANYCIDRPKQVALRESIQCDKRCARQHCVLAEADVMGCFKALTAEKVFEILRQKILL